ncbi:hypothetical protein V495_03218 [Pseudogymnoascus sp. VKM F-4514 (FW-929)]|nr:hypothetical protein V495_03218 [Pseudogymnoascus sp. VKM F-4514 (FW-929)]
MILLRFRLLIKSLHIIVRLPDRHLRLLRHLIQLPTLEEVHELPKPILGKRATLDAKHDIQLLKRFTLRLGQEEEHPEEPDHVPAGVPTECTGGSEGLQETGPGDGEHEVEEPGCGGREGHALGTDVQRVRFGGVGEWHGALTGRVDHPEDVDTQCDTCNARNRAFGNEERKACEEQCQGHQGEGDEEKVASAEGVDGSGEFREVGLDEDLRGIVGDDINTTELLHEHYQLRSLHGAAVPRHRDEFLDFIAHRVATLKLSAHEELDVELVARRLTGSELAARILLDFNRALKRFIKVLPVDYKRVLAEEAAKAAEAKQAACHAWTHKDEAADDDSGEHSGGHHETPVHPGDAVRVADFVEGQIGGVPDEDAKGREHLPAHDEGAADARGRGLGGVDGDGGGFGTDAEAEEEARDEHVPPGVGEGLPEAGHGGEEASQEDGAAAAEPGVEGDGEPAADKGAAEIGGRVEEADQPG